MSIMDHKTRKQYYFSSNDKDKNEGLSIKYRGLFDGCLVHINRCMGLEYLPVSDVCIYSLILYTVCEHLFPEFALIDFLFASFFNHPSLVVDFEKLELKKTNNLIDCGYSLSIDNDFYIAKNDASLCSKPVVQLPHDICQREIIKPLILHNLFEVINSRFENKKASIWFYKFIEEAYIRTSTIIASKRCLKSSVFIYDLISDYDFYHITCMIQRLRAWQQQQQQSY